MLAVQEHVSILLCYLLIWLLHILSWYVKCQGAPSHYWKSRPWLCADVQLLCICAVWVWCGDEHECKEQYQDCWLKHLVRSAFQLRQRSVPVQVPYLRVKASMPKFAICKLTYRQDCNKGVSG